MSTRVTTAADLGFTGPTLHARPATDESMDVIVTEVLGYGVEWRGTVRTRVAVVAYRAPGVLEPITLPLRVGDLHIYEGSE